MIRFSLFYPKYQLDSVGGSGSAESQLQSNFLAYVQRKVLETPAGEEVASLYNIFEEFVSNPDIHKATGLSEEEVRQEVSLVSGQATAVYAQAKADWRVGLAGAVLQSLGQPNRPKSQPIRPDTGDIPSAGDSVQNVDDTGDVDSEDDQNSSDALTPGLDPLPGSQDSENGVIRGRGSLGGVNGSGFSSTARPPQGMYSAAGNPYLSALNKAYQDPYRMPAGGWGGASGGSSQVGGSVPADEPVKSTNRSNFPADDNQGSLPGSGNISANQDTARPPRDPSYSRRYTEVPDPTNPGRMERVYLDPRPTNPEAPWNTSTDGSYTPDDPAYVSQLTQDRLVPLQDLPDDQKVQVADKLAGRADRYGNRVEKAGFRATDDVLDGKSPDPQHQQVRESIRRARSLRQMSESVRPGGGLAQRAGRQVTQAAGNLGRRAAQAGSRMAVQATQAVVAFLGSPAGWVTVGVILGILLVFFFGFMVIREIYCRPIADLRTALEFVQNGPVPGKVSELRQRMEETCPEVNQCGSTLGDGSKDQGVGVENIPCLSAPRTGDLADPHLRALARAISQEESRGDYTIFNGSCCWGRYQWNISGPSAMNTAREILTPRGIMIPQNPYSTSQAARDELARTFTPELQDLAFAASWKEEARRIGFDGVAELKTENEATVRSFLDKMCYQWEVVCSPNSGVDLGTEEDRRDFKQDLVYGAYVKLLVEEKNQSCGQSSTPSPPSGSSGTPAAPATQTAGIWNIFGPVRTLAQEGDRFRWLPAGNAYDAESFRSTGGKFTRSDDSGGVDIVIAPPGAGYEGSKGTPIFAQAPGVVTHVQGGEDSFAKGTRASGSYGNQVAVYYPSLNVTAVYSHMDSVSVKVGQQVGTGALEEALLGTQGDTGSTSGNTPDGKFVHIDLRLFEGRLPDNQPYGDLVSGADDRYNIFVMGMLDYYNANEKAILAKDFKAVANRSSSAGVSSGPCAPGVAGSQATTSFGQPCAPGSTSNCLPPEVMKRMQMVVTSCFIRNNGWEYHGGVDYVLTLDGSSAAPVPATVAGVVDWAEYAGAYGNSVSIKGTDGYHYIYAHMASLNVKAGENIVVGQVLGIQGSTGVSDGAHVHFGRATDSGHVKGGPGQAPMAAFSRTAHQNFAMQVSTDSPCNGG